jgi:hypothetical protein
MSGPRGTMRPPYRRRRVVRELVDGPGGLVRLRMPVPDAWIGMIIPTPPPGWHDHVRAAFADWLSIEAESVLQSVRVPVSVDVQTPADGPEGAWVSWDDVEGTKEQTAALIAAIIIIIRDRAPAGMRYAKRTADRALALVP